MSIKAILWESREKMESRIKIAHYDCATGILGYGLRLIFWLQGCHKRCIDCMTPEFLAFNGGQSLTDTKLLSMIRFYINELHIDGITFSGGDPLLQFSNFQNILLRIKSEYPNLDITLFTGYTYNVQEKQLENLPSSISNIDLSAIDLLIDGEYKKHLAGNFLLRGSSNQKLIPLSLLGKERLNSMQANFEKNNLALSQIGSPFLIGIPRVNILTELDSRLSKMGIQR
jgi:anaerobic ribonucleoside-triphosphate reductase activating protein